MVQHDVFTSQVQMDVSHAPSQLPVGREKAFLTNGNKEVAIGSQQVNKDGERDEVYLKSIISLQRKSQAFQELLNDELPVSLPKINNGVGDEKSSVAWLSKDSLALRGNSGQNLSLFR